MAFLSGPRQVGKTTTCRAYKRSHIYINWDNDNDRLLILKGPRALIENIGSSDSSVIVFDEIHKYPDWKNYIKGFYDSYAKGHFQVIITGSSRFDVYRKGADSLMGRYFLYRMHPVSVGEIIYKSFPRNKIRKPAKISNGEYETLLSYGGFPEPFIRKNKRFYNKWKYLRKQLLFREDIRDLTRIQEISQVQVLAELILLQAAQICNYVSFARKIRASENSIRKWISTLESLYYCFTIRPWSKNISRSLVKEPKIYLWDWSVISDKSARYENFIASHLLKAVNWWQDNGFGDFGLYYLRTKDKREVDFLITKDNLPWFLVEVKSSDCKLSKHLEYFQDRTGAKHAFQVVIEKDFQNKDCFSFSYPVAVPATTFLSQLV
ncbi:MAG: ATP-binding protein [Elusimicrobia bacterium]|nr:ATP-binding protein [Elusimicrobiota bacterium]